MILAGAAAEEIANSDDDTKEMLAKAAVSPILGGAMLNRKFRGMARKAAAIGNLESRSKFGWGAARSIDTIAPQYQHLTQKFDDLLHSLHQAEGQQLDYDNLKKQRIALEEKFKNMDSASEAVLNARLGGSTTPWPPNSSIPHADLDQLLSFMQSSMENMNRLENEHFARIGLASPENLEVTTEFHPKFQSLNSRNPFALPNNLLTILGVPRPGMRRFPGLTASNAPRMHKAIADWLEGNASWDGEKVVWREGKGRGWWKSEKGGTHDVELADGRKLNPDTIKTEEEFWQWMAAEPERLTSAILHGSSGLTEATARLDENLERALKIPYLGEVVHQVSVIDMIREMERRVRLGRSLEKLPDGFFTDLEKLGDDIAAEQEVLQGIRDNAGAHPEKKRTAAAELDDLFLSLRGAVGVRQQGKVGTLTSDAMDIIGRSLNDGPANGLRWLHEADQQLADLTNKLWIKYNPSSGLRQEPQSLIAAAASGDMTKLKNYAFSRTKALPVVSRFSNDKLEILRNTHVTPSRDASGLMKGLSKLRQEFRLQAEGTAQIEAASIDAFMRTLGEQINSPKASTAEYLERVLGRSGTDALRAAFAAGDLGAAFEIARPLVIRELDQINGSGVATSKPTLLKSTTGARLLSRLVSTPLTVTGSILGAKDRYGAHASANPMRSKVLSLAALGGGQLLTNPAVIATPYVAGAMAVAMGSPFLGAWYLTRDAMDMESEEQLKARGTLETLGAMAGRAAGGDTRSAAGLGMAAFSSAVPTKLASISDVILDERSRAAAGLGQPTGMGRATPWLQKAAEFTPTTLGPALMAADAAGTFMDYGPAGLVSKKSPLPLFRSVMPNRFMPKDFSLSETVATPGVQTVIPETIGEKKVDKKTQIKAPVR